MDQNELPVTCEYCNTKNPSSSKFCSQCGASISASAIKCKKCQTLNTATSKYCRVCGEIFSERNEHNRELTPDRAAEWRNSLMKFGFYRQLWSNSKILSINERCHRMKAQIPTLQYTPAFGLIIGNFDWCINKIIANNKETCNGQIVFTLDGIVVFDFDASRIFTNSYKKISKVQPLSLSPYKQDLVFSDHSEIKMYIRENSTASVNTTKVLGIVDVLFSIGDQSSSREIRQIGNNLSLDRQIDKYRELHKQGEEFWGVVNTFLKEVVSSQ